MAKESGGSSAPRKGAAAGGARVRWNTEHLKSSYANFCNATGTQEEVVLTFGINVTWDRAPKELEVDLQHRLVLSPFAAKRLHDVLSRLMAEYENRYGELK